MKKEIIFATLLVFVACTPQPAKAVTFDPNVRYSRIAIDNCLYHFQANTTQAGFAKYDATGALVSASESSRGFDYVPGLVAKAVLECIELYQDSTWVAPWFYSIQAYGEAYYNNTHSGESLDDLNACKLYFGLYDLTKTGAKFANATVADHCQIAKGKALTGLSNHNTNQIISSATSTAFCGDGTYIGGWWHKDSYEDQLWLDGQYMGPALLAMMVADGRYISGTATGDWAIIRKQFDMCWNRLWDSDKKLLYHAFSANPTSSQTTNWADHSDSYATNPHYGVSSEFWGRAAGWYFFALVDILEQMDKVGKNGSDADYLEFKRQLEAVADGLLARQDATTGCWCQLLQYGNGVMPPGCSSKTNYLESSASAIFVSTFLKGIRLGYLSRAKYEIAAKKGYRGLVNQFLATSVGDGNDYALINCCASAGLSGTDRIGDAAYYLAETGKKDTKKITNYTEGKVLGAFILAAVEYERAYPPEEAAAGDECKCLRVTFE